MDTNLRITSGSVSDRGLSEKRPQNEDSFLEMAQCGLYAVADGVGGAQAGEVASQMAMEILAEAFTNRHDGDDAESVMKAAIERANGAIHQMAEELPQLSRMATTVVALHVAGNIATIGHVGDSRLYRVDRDGTIHRETEDHSMVAEEVRAGRMTEEQAENHPSRNIISRALGADPFVKVDLKTIMVGPGTAFLICTDGVTRHVGDQEIKGVLTFGGEAAEICEYLKGLCYERGAEDNLTAVVVKVTAGEADDVEHIALEIADDQDTLATARTADMWKPNDDDDQLLELDSGDRIKPVFFEPEDESEFGLATIPVGNSGEPTIALEDKDSLDFGDKTIKQFEEEHLAAPATVEDIAAPTESVKETHDGPFSMFGDSGTTPVVEKKSGALGKVVTALGMLVLGSAIGLGVYHYVIAPRLAAAVPPPLTEMKSENIPFSSFEKNRRNVDSDPAAYLKEIPLPKDAEDNYLMGRAHLLLGEYTKALPFLVEAQKLAGGADASNSKVLSNDIATALVIANDPAAQAKLKEQLSPKPAANTNINAANSNANRK